MKIGKVRPALSDDKTVEIFDLVYFFKKIYINLKRARIKSNKIFHKNFLLLSGRIVENNNELKRNDSLKKVEKTGSEC